jgi:acetyltransferase-like isoleucine patch superfamily enzyme
VIVLGAFVASLAASPLAPWADREPWYLTGHAEKIVRRLASEADGGSHDGIVVHASATVEEGAVVKPPAVIGADCFVAAGAYLRGGVWLDAGVIIGPGA